MRVTVASGIMAGGAGQQLPPPPQLLAVGKLTDDLLLVRKFSSRNAKFGAKNHFFYLGTKLKFCAPIISCVGNLQLPVLTTFLPTMPLTVAICCRFLLIFCRALLHFPLCVSGGVPV